MNSGTGPIRVLHVIRRLDVARGAERIVAELARQLPHHDVLVFDGGQSVYQLDSGKIRPARNFVSAAWQCHRLRRHYDVFHLHLAPSIYLAILLGRKSVIHEHTTFYARRRRLLPRILTTLAMRRTRAIIAVSQSVREKVCSHLQDRARVRALPNFVAQLPKPSSVPVPSRDLLMVAAFDGPKQQELMIRALVHLPEHLGVTFAGDGVRLSDCRSLARRLGVDHRVTFAGSVGNVSDYFANARMCVLISKWEGFGLVVLEAAQFGKATVVSDIESLREICPDQRLLFSGATPEELANKLLQALEHVEQPGYSDRLKEHAARHRLEPYVARLEQIYAE